jgi:hypothetical protein
MSSEPKPHARLQAVHASFILPHGDNKDWDTRISIAVAKDGVAIARHDDFAGTTEFPDPGSYGPYAIPVQTPVTVANYRGSETTVIITPNGNDRVIWNVRIDATFEDGIVLSSESGNIILDQDNRTHRFRNP